MTRRTGKIEEIIDALTEDNHVLLAYTHTQHNIQCDWQDVFDFENTDQTFIANLFSTLPNLHSLEVALCPPDPGHKFLNQDADASLITADISYPGTPFKCFDNAWADDDAPEKWIAQMFAKFRQSKFNL